MAIRFLQRLLRALCPHRFTWPRTGAHGQDYQVCVICGAAYEYDWTSMRRTRPLESSRYSGPALGPIESG